MARPVLKANDLFDELLDKALNLAEADGDQGRAFRSAGVLEVRMRVRAEYDKQLKDAERWRALLGSDRIRVLGHAHHGLPTMHVGLELWVTYPGKEQWGSRNALNADLLTVYADEAIKAGRSRC